MDQFSLQVELLRLHKIKKSLIKLESDFTNFKIETESKLSNSVFVENQVFLDKVNSIIQSQKLENKNLHSKIYDLEVSKELLTNKVKTLEDQNKHQFRQIGKLEGQINNLTTLVKNLFKSNMQSEPNTCSEDDEVVVNIPTNNKFNPLMKEPTANIDRKVEHISPEKDQRSMPSSIQIQQPTRNQQDYHQMHQLERNNQITHQSLEPNIPHGIPIPPIYNREYPIIHQPYNLKEHPEPFQISSQPYYNDLSMPKIIPLQFTPTEIQATHTSQWKPAHQPEPQPTSSNDNQFSSNPESCRSRITKEKSDTSIDSDIVMIMDSNGGKINPKLLYPVDGSNARKMYCPLLEDFENLLEHCSFEKSPTVVILHFGTNNLDTSDPNNVITKLTEISTALSTKLPSSKIVVRGFLPRKDFSSRDIHNMNTELSKKLQLKPNIHFAAHANLNNQEATKMLGDEKHLN